MTHAKLLELGYRFIAESRDQHSRRARRMYENVATKLLVVANTNGATITSYTTWDATDRVNANAQFTTGVIAQ